VYMVPAVSRPKLCVFSESASQGPWPPFSAETQKLRCHGVPTDGARRLTQEPVGGLIRSPREFS